MIFSQQRKEGKGTAGLLRIPEAVMYHTQSTSRVFVVVREALRIEELYYC